MDKVRVKIRNLSEKYQRAWLPLGRELTRVKMEKLFRNWPDDNNVKFRSFTQYCEHDLKIGSTVASDMVKAFQYIATHHKELIDSVRRNIPDYNLLPRSLCEILFSLNCIKGIYGERISIERRGGAAAECTTLDSAAAKYG